MQDHLPLNYVCQSVYVNMFLFHFLVLTNCLRSVASTSICTNYISNKHLLYLDIDILN